jgi:hypothetical protein
MNNIECAIDILECCHCKNTIKNNHFASNGLEDDGSIHRVLYQQKIRSKFQLFIVAAAAVLVSPMITFAQLPNLGTAINYTLYTAVGAISNTGITNITGDIGTNLGAITGFNPLLVSGNIDIANAATAQAALDVQAAYNDISSRPQNTAPHAPIFGNGETILPGVYHIASAASLAGNLTLDGANDSSSIFIISVVGAFTSGALTTVNLINGALASRVFWVASGAMSLDAGTTMKGTLIAGVGAVSMAAGGDLEGRLLSTTGAIAVGPGGIVAVGATSTLSINLHSFRGLCDEQNVVLQWRTATETNNNFFTIERSISGEIWDIVGEVTGAGNSFSSLSYTLTDFVPLKGISYYRLKQTDFNGDFSYEDIISIEKCKDNGANHFIIYPNPSEGKFKLLFNGNSDDLNSIEIYNSHGESIYSSNNFQSTFDLSNNVPGFYFMRVQHNSGISSMKFTLSN